MGKESVWIGRGGDSSAVATPFGDSFGGRGGVRAIDSLIDLNQLTCIPSNNEKEIK